MSGNEAGGKERFGSEIGRGAVLYDTRAPQRRPCCSRAGRCLAHVTGIYTDSASRESYYQVWDGTHTVREWIHEDDIDALFEPAGWQCDTVEKPTYILTRGYGVEDHHDLMTDGGKQRPDPEDDPFACSICGAPLGTVKRIEGEEYCAGCLRDAGILPPVDAGNSRYIDTEGDRE